MSSPTSAGPMWKSAPTQYSKAPPPDWGRGFPVWSLAARVLAAWVKVALAQFLVGPAARLGALVVPVVGVALVLVGAIRQHLVVVRLTPPAELLGADLLLVVS